MAQVSHKSCGRSQLLESCWEKKWIPPNHSYLFQVLSTDFAETNLYRLFIVRGLSRVRLVCWIPPEWGKLRGKPLRGGQLAPASLATTTQCFPCWQCVLRKVQAWGIVATPCLLRASWKMNASIGDTWAIFKQYVVASCLCVGWRRSEHIWF